MNIGKKLHWELLGETSWAELNYAQDSPIKLSEKKKCWQNSGGNLGLKTILGMGWFVQGPRVGEVFWVKSNVALNCFLDCWINIFHSHPGGVEKINLFLRRRKKNLNMYKFILSVELSMHPNKQHKKLIWNDLLTNKSASPVDLDQFQVWFLGILNIIHLIFLFLLMVGHYYWKCGQNQPICT